MNLYSFSLDTLDYRIIGKENFQHPHQKLKLYPYKMFSSLSLIAQAIYRSTKESSTSSSTASPKSKDSLQSFTSYDDLVFLKKISQTKFSVYLVQSSSTRTQLALKAFPHRNGATSPQYLNEVRFSHLSHPNIISMVDYQEDGSLLTEKLGKTSYILMEYASHGDFFDLIMDFPSEWEDKLIRTYFHQLIEGVEYLHSQGIAHLDLKLENLLVGEDFTLKIADFDLAHMSTDSKLRTKGTKHYRAPELLNQECHNPQAADIYSAGILLFTMKCGGIMPHLEDKPYNGVHLCDMLHYEPELFWQQHHEIQKKKSGFFDKDFKELFEMMTRPEAIDRASLAKIKKSKWYQGPVYSKKELRGMMQDAWDQKH